MKAVLYVMCGFVMLSTVLSCGRVKETEHSINNNSSSKRTNLPSVPKIGAEEAVSIAKSDFVKVIGPLDHFKIVHSEQPDGWHIEFHLKDRTLDGGSATYIIDKETGKISDRKVTQ